ncbi:FAD-dependent oxidoreductase [Collinsella tanakaei]|uniref:FAD-dependent oxidoreductase n=1 Tax=Collinsella tanakaei TaxID=626935 RepID=UPI0025A3874E|nr:FAD-dependent oxidoreductase [Collinsella tanakaei]MDM8301735.1 FAD-dependent oxidoreductase [Collinsella tanakaei]
MSAHYPNLFSPIKIGNVEVPNRIAMMPMGVFSPRLMDLKTGAYTKDGADYYIERAKGGTGLIITGLVPIIPLPGMNPVNFPDEYVEKLSYLTNGIHEQGSRIFIQLTAMTGRAAWFEGDAPTDTLPAPAPIQNVWDPTITNRGITKDEIHAYVRNFATAASLVKRAGGDGVEIHAVHEGYLLDQFAISFYNRRTDEYGGSLENRLRFAREIVEAIHEQCGDDFPVSLRYSVRSYVKDFNRGALPGEKFVEVGRDLEESLEMARLLEGYGYAMLNCDNGSYDSWYWPHPPVYMPKACNLDDVMKVKEVVDIPVVCAGRFDDPDLAEKVIAEGKIDMMGMGRPQLADPEIANKFREGRLDDIRPCISCHQGCLSRIFQHKDISCAVNPACGREKSMAITPAETVKRVAVVGGGLGGMEAARVSALRGHTVDLFEKTGELGGVFVWAASLDFKEDDRRLLAWYKKQMVDLGVNVHLNTEATADTVAGYDEVNVATGATERRLDTPGFDSPNVTYAIDTLSAHDEFEGDDVVIVGGGLTGCEIAYDLGRKGKHVTIVEMTETILNTFGLAAANYNMLMDLLDYYHVRVIKNAVVQKYEDGVAYVEETEKNYPNCANRAKRMFALGPQGEKLMHKIPADHIVACVGYTANQELYDQLAKTVDAAHLHLIGDAIRPANVMEAIWTAYETAIAL